MERTLCFHSVEGKASSRAINAGVKSASNRVSLPQNRPYRPYRLNRPHGPLRTIHSIHSIQTVRAIQTVQTIQTIQIIQTIRTIQTVQPVQTVQTIRTKQHRPYKSIDNIIDHNNPDHFLFFYLLFLVAFILYFFRMATEPVGHFNDTFQTTGRIWPKLRTDVKLGLVIVFILVPFP